MTETRTENLERRRCPARGSGTCRQTLGGRRCGQRPPRCGPVEGYGLTLRGRKPCSRATGSADKAAQRRHPPASPGRRAGSRSGGRKGVAGAGRRPRAETARASNRDWGAGCGKPQAESPDSESSSLGRREPYDGVAHPGRSREQRPAPFGRAAACNEAAPERNATRPRRRPLGPGAGRPARSAPASPRPPPVGPLEAHLGPGPLRRAARCANPPRGAGVAALYARVRYPGAEARTASSPQIRLAFTLPPPPRPSSPSSVLRNPRILRE